MSGESVVAGWNYILAEIVRTTKYNKQLHYNLPALTFLVMSENASDPENQLIWLINL